MVVEVVNGAGSAHGKEASEGKVAGCLGEKAGCVVGGGGGGSVAVAPG